MSDPSPRSLCRFIGVMALVYYVLFVGAGYNTELSVAEAAKEADKASRTGAATTR